MTDQSCCHEPKKKWYQSQVRLSLAGITLLALATTAIPFLFPLRQNLWMYARLVTGYFLLGVLIGGLIDYFIPKETISRYLAGSQKRIIFRSVFLGFLMSACSHGILAISMALYKKGASVSSVISFLLASPWANMAVTVLLVGLFGWKGILMIVLAMLVAVVTGLFFQQLEKRGWVRGNLNTVEARDWKLEARKNKSLFQLLASSFQSLAGIFRSSYDLLEMILGWVTLGVVLAAVIATFVPSDFFYRWLGPTPRGLAATMLGASVIEVCSEGSAPLAFEIYRQTAALGNTFAFLMAGVATDYTELGLIGSNMGWKTALWLLAVNLPLIFICGLLLNFL